MTRRLRIVHVTGCLDLGGQEKLLVEFARHANRDRFALRFVSLGTRGVIADELEALGWPVSALELPPGLHPGFPLRLATLLRRWRADVVHTHNERPLIYAAPASRLARARGLIHTKHGRGAGNSRRQTFLAALMARLTDHFVCVSADCADLAEQDGVPPRRIVTLANGIDLQRFPGVGPAPGAPAVIVARLCPEKDHETLLHAVAIVVQTAPAFRLLIAGDGPCLPQLQQLVDRLGLDGRVQFLGSVGDVPALLRRAGMMVLSSASEGMPLTLLEGMASGLPVVATNVGGVTEVVQDEFTGLLVPRRDPQALAMALVRLQLDEPLARRLGEQGRRRAVEHFDVVRMVAKYEKLYVSPGGAKVNSQGRKPLETKSRKNDKALEGRK
jgi:glycosyltransferase involved in cell wall biosynthesis